MCVCFVVLRLSLFFATISWCTKDLYVYCCDLWAQLLSHSSSVRNYVLYVAYFHAHVRYNAVARPSVVCLSVVCNVRMPYSAGWKFRQCFYAVRYLGHPLTSVENFTEIVRAKPLRWGEGLNARGVAKYSDFWPIYIYISETVQDRR